jgi:hypothetical protein
VSEWVTLRRLHSLAISVVGLTSAPSSSPPHLLTHSFTHSLTHRQTLLHFSSLPTETIRQLLDHTYRTHTTPLDYYIPLIHLLTHSLTHSLTLSEESRLRGDTLTLLPKRSVVWSSTGIVSYTSTFLSVCPVLSCPVWFSSVQFSSVLLRITPIFLMAHGSWLLLL